MNYNRFSQDGDLIIVDIGTHEGQEINSIINSRLFIYKVIRRVTRDLIKQTESINLKKINYYLKLIKSHLKIKREVKRMVLITVEPNFFHFCNPIYKQASLVVPFAINDEKNTSKSLIKLYIANGDPLSQGNSIYDAKGNVDKNNFLNVFSLTSKNLIDIIKDEYIKPSSKIILRINCEGSEDSIIYNFKNNFSSQLVGILGSLKDVKDIKGVQSYEKLINFMDQNRLNYIPFSSDVKSWLKAHNFILSKL